MPETPLRGIVTDDEAALFASSIVQDGGKRPLLAFQKSQTQSLTFPLNIGRGAFDAAEQCHPQTAKDLRGAEKLGRTFSQILIRK